MISSYRYDYCRRQLWPESTATIAERQKEFRENKLKIHDVDEVAQLMDVVSLEKDSSETKVI
jgi:hypothetical protein